MDVHIIMLAIVVLIVFLEGSRGLTSDFAARKLCHAGCGLGIMMLDSNRLDCQLFVYSVAASSILMTWNLSPLPPFRFSRPRDVGLTVYLTLVALWFAWELPPRILAPLFFADPAGAVVGKTCSQYFGPRYNFPWYQKKTVCGTFAVFVFTYLTITFEASGFARRAIAASAAVVEALGGDYDNLCIAAVVLAGWQLCGGGTA